MFFEGESSAVANGGALAATRGGAATERDAFAYVRRKDVASGFGVSASETISRKIAIPALGVDDAERKRRRRTLLRSHTTGRLLLQSVVAGRSCASEPSCVAAAEVEVLVQATEAQAEGVTVSYEERAAKVADAEARADDAVARLVLDPGAFFAETLETLGPEVTAAIVGNVTREEKTPEPPAPFRDLFDMLPVGPWTFFGFAAVLVAAVVAYPRASKRLREAYRAYQLRRALRAVALGTAGFGDARPEMRAMTTESLAELAKYKAERAKSRLDKMWDRRTRPPPSVKASEQQFGGGGGVQ